MKLEKAIELLKSIDLRQDKYVVDGCRDVKCFNYRHSSWMPCVLKDDIAHKVNNDQLCLPKCPGIYKSIKFPYTEKINMGFYSLIDLLADDWGIYLQEPYYSKHRYDYLKLSIKYLEIQKANKEINGRLYGIF